MTVRHNEQLFIGIMSSSVPPPGVANVPLMDSPESTLMSFVSHKSDFTLFTVVTENLERQDINII